MVERHARHPDHLGVGGAAANAALAFIRAGGRAILACRLAEDEHLPLIKGELERVGLWSSAVAVGGLFNAVYTIGGGCPYSRFGYTREGSAGSGLSPDDLDVELIRKADVIGVSGIFTCLNGTTRATVDQLLDLAGPEALVAYDVNYRPTLAAPSRAVEIYEELSPRFSIVKADLDEARMIWGDGDPLEVALLGASRHRYTLVTRGEEGLILVAEGKPVVVTPTPIVTVDPTGAGDAALGTLLYHLARGRSPETTAREAAEAGARCVRHLGAWGYATGVPG
jgi:2-dehydro-3-deoxygluconokinase